MTLLELFDLAKERQASDIHLATGEIPRLRIAGELVPLEGTLDLPTVLESLLAPEAHARLGAGLPLERTIVYGDLAFVAILFRVGEEGLAATIRLIPNGVPPLNVIGEDALPLFERLKEAPRGLILVVGRTGSGKWTTASALTDAINAERAARIFVVERHPSLRFTSRKGMVTQFHVGEDCESYARALEIAHQADLDVVAMDDIPTYEALRQALVLADTGHLVIANLSAETVADAIERLLLVAGEDAPVLRRALAESLVAATGQRLVPSTDGTGRVPIYEWIVSTPDVRAALLGGDDLRAVQARDPECRTVAYTARDLYMSGRIAFEPAFDLSQTEGLSLQQSG